MTHTNTTVPPPPYNYNDYRIIYNEKCFFYNGGFDLTCLVTRRRGGGGGIGRYPEKSYPSIQMINLVFKVCVDYVNDKNYDEDEFCEIKKYSFEKKKSDIIIRTEKLIVKRKILNITSDEFSVKVIEKFLSSSNPILNKKDTYISSSLEKLKTYVSSSLYFKKPRKIKINSSLLKDKNKKDKE